MKNHFLSLVLSLIIGLPGMVLLHKYCPINVDVISFSVLGVTFLLMFIIYGWFYEKGGFSPILKFVITSMLIKIFSTDLAFFICKYVMHIEPNMFALLFFVLASPTTFMLLIKKIK